MDNVEKAKAILGKVSYAAIASVSESGEPWNAPVFIAFDDSYHFYWASSRSSHHSKNICTCPNVFLVIYDSTAEAGTGEGVYIRAIAEELIDSDEIAAAYQLLCDRHQAPFWKLEEMEGESPIHLYRAMPQQVWINAGEKVNGVYVDVRVEVSLTQR